MTVLGSGAALAQQNVGSACGCPATTSRTAANVQTAAAAAGVWSALPSNAYGGEITGNFTLTCDKIWTIDQKIYVKDGATLTIEPGTVIKGAVAGSAAAATALIIERGGKIMAPGTESCPIIFTASADALDGLYPVSNKGMWGGVILLGKATNNLTLSANGPYVPGGNGKLAVADGLGVMEGFASSIPQDQFGVQTSATPSNVTTATSPATTSYTFSQATSAGSLGAFTITLTGNGSYALAGMTVSGTGIAAGATVVSTSSNVITLSAANTGAVSGNATFTGTFPLAANTTTQFYTATVPTFTSGTGPFTAAAGTLNSANYAAPYSGGSSSGSFNDDDNSGVMTYVSIRHAGASLLVGSEINGLSLASVGRGTKIEHIEIVSCADDNIEIFGGTVNLKYVTTIFGNDDMFDYDLGWKGKAQFLFGMKADQAGAGTSISPDNDNGFEADADDNKSNLTTRSHPIVYNATIIGNSKSAGTSDNSGLAAIQAKELTEGEIYNSIFANFRNGLNLVKSYSLPRTSGTGGESWHNWYNAGTSADANGGNGSQSLKIKCNTFVNMTNALTVGASSASAGTNLTGATTSGGTVAAGLEYTQFTTTDKNDVVASIPGFSYNFAINGTSNAISTKNDVIPNPALSVTGCPTAPVDGFYEPAPYRGAFSSTPGENWLSDWTYSLVLGTTSGVTACPTDLDFDGDTDVNDFLIFAPAYGTSCN